MDSLSLDLGSDLGASTPTRTSPPAALRNLQPRAAAAMDFNDNDTDEEDGGVLSKDYRAQRETMKDLVALFNSSPPGSPRPQQPRGGGGGGGSAGGTRTATNSSVGEDDKKKRSLLQRFRTKKSTPSVISGGSGNQRSSVVVSQLPGTSSNISTLSSVTTGKGKNGEEVTTATLPNGKKYIMIAVDYKETEGGNSSGSGGGNSSTHQASGGGNGGGSSTLPPSAASSMYVASRPQSRIPENSEDALYMSAGHHHHLLSDGRTTEAARRSVVLQTAAIDSGPFVLGNLALDTSAAVEASEVIPRSMPARTRTESEGMESKRVSKVTFSPPLGEAEVAEALVQRIASHKAKQQVQQPVKSDDGDTTAAAAATTCSVATSTQDISGIILPKPVSRKKVRHVQIQTQHCVMRPMHTQTEPYEFLMHDFEEKGFFSSSSIWGSTCDVASLKRDLAAETRARTRTAVAMQDTRDKFEMLSAMAYKKLKEMIFQRHVLEMEVRELRAQVDLQSEASVVQQGEMLFRQEMLLQQQQQKQYQLV
ncbi:hypothetical protein BGZ65_011034 [Modicella reniformis]|uniref:Uncharacterized protein n=1 Tax=Modicella reniformis TaxID=1440133 RepID=A0A9P6IN86_9FUNG|nr:hypothetical protein BGZ65_011034 [Modicella reniformis]